MTFVTNSDRPWPLGVVSNCWKVQLDSGVELDSLIGDAVRRGLTVVELRQGSLGKYEASAECVPQAERLAELAHRFPGVRFNMALSLPCLSGELSREEPLFLAGRAAAITLAGQQTPHLRLVDLQTKPEQCSLSSVEVAARGVVELTEAMIDIQGILSIEHSRQPWSWLDFVMQSAWQQLAERRSRLQLCFDPCNLLLTEPIENVAGIVESVRPDDVSMIHVKQRRDGHVQPDIGDGDLDWRTLLETLSRRGYSAPVLFEIAPHVDVWANLDGGIARLFGASAR